MKYLRYGLLLAVAALLVTAVVLNARRDAVARNILNSMLENTGLTATELSIASLRPGRLVLRRVQLVQDNGSSYVLRGLTMPIELPAMTISSMSADALVVTPASGDAPPASLAALLDIVLGLPGQMPGFAVEIGRVDAPGVPAVESLAWQTVDGGQSLTLRAAGVAATAHIGRLSEGQREATLAAGPEGDEQALTATLRISRGAGHYAIHGAAASELAPWQEALAALGALTAPSDSLLGRLSATVAASLPFDESTSSTVVAAVAAETNLSASLTAGGRQLSVRSEAPPAFRFELAWPSLNWRLESDRVDTRVGIDFATALSVSARQLDCNGERCELRLRAAASRLSLEGMQSGNASLEGRVTLEPGEVPALRIDGLATRLSDVETPDFHASSLSVDSAAPVRLRFPEAGLEATASELGVVVEALTTGAGWAAGAPLTVTGFTLAETGGRASGNFAVAAGKAVIERGGFRPELPGAAGRFERSAETTRVTATLSGPGTDAEVDLVQDEGGTLVNVSRLELGFGDLPASKRLADWPYAWDVLGGTLEASGELSWPADGGEPSAAFRLGADALAGLYEDVAVTGAATELAITLDSTGLAAGPAPFSIALVEVGMPIRDISGRAEWLPEANGVRISDLVMSAMGGTVSAEPFVYALGDLSADIELDLDAIQLGFIVDVARFESVELTGSIEGSVPVRLEGSRVTVSDGRLESEPPGGSIRYVPAPGASFGGSQLDTVRRALSNLEYESLVSDVSYDEEGNLELDMKIRGVNPDMDPTQPVVLNLSIDNNVPALLRSLQSTRAIEDIIEKRQQR